MTTKVTKWGNSLAVRIPKQLSDSFSLKEGSPLEFEEIDGKIMLRLVQNRRGELVESFKRAARDSDIKSMSEEGMDDYIKQVETFD